MNTSWFRIVSIFEKLKHAKCTQGTDAFKLCQHYIRRYAGGNFNLTKKTFHMRKGGRQLRSSSQTDVFVGALATSHAVPYKESRSLSHVVRTVRRYFTNSSFNLCANNFFGKSLWKKYLIVISFSSNYGGKYNANVYVRFNCCSLRIGYVDKRKYVLN